MFRNVQSSRGGGASGLQQKSVYDLNEDLDSALYEELGNPTGIRVWATETPDVRTVLLRWKGGSYELPDPPLLGYMLSNQYDEDDIKKGTEILEGKDARLVSRVLPLAAELGFIVCLAAALKSDNGWADDDYDSESDDYHHVVEFPPDILRGEDPEVQVSNVVCISCEDGDGPRDMGIGEFEFDDELLVPRDAFDSTEPCEISYKRSRGNERGHLMRFWKGTLLVIFRKEDEAKALMSMGGSSAVLRNLKATNTPTASAEKLVDSVLANLDNSSDALAILEHAVAWKHLDTWLKAIVHIGTTPGSVDDVLRSALQIFTLEAIRPGITQLVKRCTMLQRQVAIIKALVTQSGEQGANAAWVEGLAKEALSSYAAADIADIPTLLQIANGGSVTILQSDVLPRLSSKPGTFDFHVALAKALCEREQPTSEMNNEGNPVVGETVLRQCIRGAIAQWQNTVPRAPGPTPRIKVHRIEQLVSLIFDSQDTGLCDNLFKAVPTGHRMDVLTAIKGHLENEVPTWAKELVMEALSTYTAPAVSDVPTLSWIAQVMGAKPIFEMVEQKVPDTGTYEFLIALARSLHDLRSVLSIEDSIAAGQQEAELARTIHHCISAAIPQWEVGVEIPQQVRSFHGIFDIPVYYNGVGPNPKVDRIIDLVELCFKIDDLAPLTTLLENLLQIPAKTTVHDRFRVLYKPLVPRLKTTSTALGQSMALEPFKSFFKNVISLYLARILGVVPAFPPPTLPNTNIGCGCSHCEQITPWLSRSTAKLTFQAVQQTRTHIEGQITKARISHLARMSTDATGRPYTLVVNKVPELEAALVWRDAQKLAEEFIESVADTDATKVIMQDRYQDATDALSGVKVFILGDMRVARRGDIIPGEGILPLVPGAAGATVPVAGVKRKQPS